MISLDVIFLISLSLTFIEAVDVSLNLSGLGTNENPWILTQDSINDSLRKITWTDKTLNFPAGIYYSEKPLVIDFAVRCQNDSNAREILREGVAIVGEHRGSIIQFPQLIGLQQPSLLITFTPEVDGTQSAIFFYEFRGLSIKGESDYALVSFGRDIESSPWNSCIFDLNVNNGYTKSSDARGLIVYRGLRSDFNLDVTCGRGTALVLVNNEFSTYRGSFSNAEDSSTNPVSIYSDSYGLLLNNAVNLHFQSINLEVIYNGIKFINSCQGNLFSSVIANNQDENGVVVSYEDLYSGSRNYFLMMTRRTTRQNKTAYPKLISSPTDQIIFQYDLLS